MNTIIHHALVTDADVARYAQACVEALTEFDHADLPEYLRDGLAVWSREFLLWARQNPPPLRESSADEEWEGIRPGGWMPSPSGDWVHDHTRGMNMRILFGDP